MPIGDEVRRLREAAGLAQQELADAAGTSRSFLAMVEQGRRDRLGADVLFRLARALGVSCEHFRPFLDPDPPRSRPSGKRK